MSNEAQTELGSVVSLWQYPVKSMMGEELNATEVTERGLLGIVRMPWWTAPTGKWQPQRTRENGRVSSIFAPTL